MNETLDEHDRELDLALRDAFAGECPDVEPILPRHLAAPVSDPAGRRAWLVAACVLLGVAVVAFAVTTRQAEGPREPLQDPVGGVGFDLRPQSLEELLAILERAQSATLIPRVDLAQIGPGEGPNGLNAVDCLAETVRHDLAAVWARALVDAVGAISTEDRQIMARHARIVPAGFGSPDGETLYRADLRFDSEDGFVSGYAAASAREVLFTVEGLGAISIPADTPGLTDAFMRRTAEATSRCGVATTAEHLNALPTGLDALFWCGADSEELTAHLGRFESLRHLDVYGPVDAALVAAVGATASLEALWLRGESVSRSKPTGSEVDLGGLAGCARLRRLSIAHVRCDLLPLTALPGLRELGLHECALRGPAGSVLATLPIERLVLNGIAPVGREIEGLSRSRSIVDAALYSERDPGTALVCLREFAKISSLRSLSLSAKGFDVGEVIAGMDQLRVLDLPGAQELLARSIRELRPDLHVALRY